MSEDKRQSELARREAAQQEAGQVDVSPVGAVRPRKIRQVFSVRLEPELIRELREVAQQRGVSISDVVREAAVTLVEENRRQSFRWQEHHQASQGLAEIRYLFPSDFHSNRAAEQQMESYGVAQVG